MGQTSILKGLEYKAARIRVLNLVGRRRIAFQLEGGEKILLNPLPDKEHFRYYLQNSTCKRYRIITINCMHFLHVAETPRRPGSLVIGKISSVDLFLK